MVRLISMIVGVGGIVLLPVASAFMLIWLIKITGIGATWSLAVWWGVSPVIYIAWLLILCALSAIEMQGLPRWFPKQRRASVKAGGAEALSVLAAAICYRRIGILASLPLIVPIFRIPTLRWLLLLAYSPHFQLGKNVMIWGFLYDPDLTEIGDDVVIGGQAAIAAHSLTSMPGGELIFVSATVRIGDRATIGGESRVAMGVTIGPDAVIEPSSNVLAFTTIPAGEVWGGNPAVFRRKRIDLSVSPPANSNAPPVAIASAPMSGDLGDSLEAAQRLVAEALGLPVETVTADSKAGDFPEWDSLGQFAIAAALQDRCGTQLRPDIVFHIDTIPDVMRLMNGSPAEGAQHPHKDDFREVHTSDLPLPRNPEFLPLLERSDVTRALAADCYQMIPAQPLRIILAASFTAAPVASSLKLWGRPFGFQVEPEFFGFNQLQQALLDPASPFRENRAGLNVVLLRPEDMPSTEAEARTYANELLQAIRRFRESTRSPLIVSTLPPAISDLYHGDRNWLDLLRADWRRSLAEIQGVEVLDLAAIIEEIGATRAYHIEFELSTRAPYTQAVVQELGAALIRIARKRRTPAVKVVALDCDNTLWGGVVGEDGVQGIALGSDGPGRSFQAFQQAVRRLKDRGILLVLVSRNEPEDVWNVFEQHPGMVLRREDIASARINWNLKSDNLRELAQELNLGLDSFVFIDDDAAVRLEVETNLPQVHVVPMPGDASHFSRTLARLWLFDGSQATEVDAARTEMMQQERERKELLETSTLGDFLQNLNLKVEFLPAGEQDLPRVAQLTQRTNQFNTSLRRRDLEQIRELDDQHLICVLNASDRFGDYGQVGACILKCVEAERRLEIDSLLLSCRALGRGVEHAFLHGIVGIAALRQADRIVAIITEGPRNQPARDFLRQAGFTESSPEQWTFDVALGFELPPHIHFVSENTPHTQTP